jgi:arsenate reductase
MTLVMYGIRNCDTVKRARAWLDERGIAYDFHDYKASGADAVQLQAWCDAVGWDRVLNRNGTTFRKLPEDETANLDARRAVALMVAHPSAIRRPIVTGASRLVVGFDLVTYEATLA